MTPEEFGTIKQSSLVRNIRTGRIYVITEGYARDTCTQITRDEVSRRLADFELIPTVSTS